MSLISHNHFKSASVTADLVSCQIDFIMLQFKAEICTTSGLTKLKLIKKIK